MNNLSLHSPNFYPRPLIKDDKQHILMNIWKSLKTIFKNLSSKQRLQHIKDDNMFDKSI